MRTAQKPPQRGIVLVTALLMLVMLSLLAATTIRNAASAESVAGAARTTNLAMQAAEVAMRHCEQSVVNAVRVQAGGASSYATDFTAANIMDAADAHRWQDTTVWDSTSTWVYTVPVAKLNQAGLRASYKRPPECMVAPVPMAPQGSTSAVNTAAFVITVRGFGPEVAAAGPSRARPQGTEVWLQSHITLE